MSERVRRVVPISIAMPPEMARVIRVAASCAGRSRSALVCDLMRDHLRDYLGQDSAEPAQACVITNDQPGAGQGEEV